MNTFWRNHASPIGPMILAASTEGMLGAWFVGQAHFAGIDENWIEDPLAPLLSTAAAQFDAWFAGKLTRFTLPLAPAGTAFQQAVWREISKIGFGETRSYGEVANAVGKPGAARAVGAATGRNPLTIIVPCHRMVGGNGSLTGYAGGLDRKRFLLAHETQDLLKTIEA